MTTQEWTARIEALRLRDGIDSSLGDAWVACSGPFFEYEPKIVTGSVQRRYMTIVRPGSAAIQTRYRMGAVGLNISIEEYRSNVERGLKWCSNQGHGWQPREAFGPHRRRPDGLNTICRDCDRATARERSARYYRARWSA